jgi:exodeoxyribonuclease-3
VAADSDENSTRRNLTDLFASTDRPAAFKIGSWNVAGLRAVMKKDPESIGKLIERLNLDVLCLQEIKLQELHLDDPKVTLPEVDGYEAHYSCSTAKKGYSGTAVFIRKRGAAKKKAKQTSMDAFVKAKLEATVPASHKLPVDAKVLTPDAVSMKMGVDKHDQEGRINVVDFPLFTFCNVYVPNAGQNLERLDYRTKEWDKDFLAFMQSKQKDRGVPVLWLGDLNVAHTNLEVWNDGAKHLAKQAGVTVQERASFQAQLDAGFVDAFRRLHPDAQGHYSYWSMRAGNRAPNKGLRLDYFICDSQFFDEETSRVIVRDSYVVEDHVGSDHCPVVLEIEIKGE